MLKDTRVCSINSCKKNWHLFVDFVELSTPLGFRQLLRHRQFDVVMADLVNDFSLHSNNFVDSLCCCVQEAFYVSN